MDMGICIGSGECCACTGVPGNDCALGLAAICFGSGPPPPPPPPVPAPAPGYDVISGWVGNVMDREGADGGGTGTGAAAAGGTGQTDPSGCMANVGAGAFRAGVCDCDGIVGVVGNGVFSACQPMFIIDGGGGGGLTAFIVANICGSDIVVNSSHGNDGSSDGCVLNSAAMPSLTVSSLPARTLGAGYQP